MKNEELVTLMNDEDSYRESQENYRIAQWEAGAERQRQQQIEDLYGKEEE